MIAHNEVLIDCRLNIDHSSKLKIYVQLMELASYAHRDSFPTHLSNARCKIPRVTGLLM